MTSKDGTASKGEWDNGRKIKSKDKRTPSPDSDDSANATLDVGKISKTAKNNRSKSSIKAPVDKRRASRK
jgi:hypothetical protein